MAQPRSEFGTDESRPGGQEGWGWMWIPMVVVGCALGVMAIVALFWVAGVVLHILAFAVKVAVVIALVMLARRIFDRHCRSRRI
ncbi:MAG: hypothetical protein ACRD0H_15390 [Actinomycetes bacterium]